VKTSTQYEGLPRILNAEDIAAYLGISKSGAYALMNSRNFPTIYVGRRMLVSADKFLSWLDAQTESQNGFCR